jgi:hypothetical protein
MSVHLIVSNVPGNSTPIVLTRMVMAPAAFTGGGS